MWSTTRVIVYNGSHINKKHLYHDYITINCEVIIFTKYHEDKTVWSGQDINYKILTYDLDL